MSIFRGLPAEYRRRNTANETGDKSVGSPTEGKKPDKKAKLIRITKWLAILVSFFGPVGYFVYITTQIPVFIVAVLETVRFALYFIPIMCVGLGTFLLAVLRTDKLTEEKTPTFKWVLVFCMWWYLYGVIAGALIWLLIEFIN